MASSPLNLIDDWFHSQGWNAFAFQRETWRAYLDGRSGLVHAPTGMGKTYAVWLGPLAEELALRHSEITQRSASGLRVLWLTPLRALANDTQFNLQAAVTALNIPWRVELRHGDTSASFRQKQRRNPPEALITTPESLSVLLSYPGANDLFRSLRCVIVDEWHELLASKRGVQTELALAHLRALAPALRTWGLSATLGNTEQAMKVLLGNPLGRQDATGALIRGDAQKQIVVNTLLPDDAERFPWSGHIGVRLLDRVIEAVERARTTLIFTNVRSAAEIWFRAMTMKRPDLLGQIALHHGSLDRDIRQQVEQLLRDGRIKCVVCTSSLDLGVDFSPVDQVLQIGSPKGIARMMQRAGRSGHQPGAKSTIVGVPTMALEMIEFAAARDAAGAEGARRAGDARLPARSLAPPIVDPPSVESREPLDRPLDVLVQHMVTLASGDGFDPGSLRNEARSTHAFGGITDDEWTWCLDFVTRGGETLTAYPQLSRVKIDDATGLHSVASKPIERMHRMSIGTITSDSSVKVAFANGSTLGMIEEGFISRLRPGDRFVFAGRVLELTRVHNMVAQVRPAKQKSGIVPRWAGGRSPLSTLLSQAIRRKLDEARQGVFYSPEMEKVRPLLELQARWSRIPAPDETLIERARTRDGHHLFVFSFEGRLVHEGLSSLVAHRVTQREPRSVQVTGNDYGFELQTARPLPLDEHALREILSTERLVDDLLGCLNTTALARRQFREIARVAGLLFPGYPGQPKSMRQLQASSELFFDVFTEFDPRNLLLDQARREVLDRELEVTRLRDTLERIQRSKLVIVDTQWLTPLSFPLWAESIRTQQVTSEKWSDRVQRMVVELEAAANEPKEIHRGEHGSTPKGREAKKTQAVRNVPKRKTISTTRRMKLK